MAELTGADAKPLTVEQLADLEVVAPMPDSKIDTSDMSEQSDWSSAKRGMFYRPIKKQVTLRLER